MLSSILLLCGSLNAMQLEKYEIMDSFNTLRNQWNDIQKDSLKNPENSPKKNPKNMNNQKNWLGVLERITTRHNEHCGLLSQLFEISKNLGIEHGYELPFKKKSSKNEDSAKLSEQSNKIAAELSAMDDRISRLIKMIENHLKNGK